MTLAFGGQYSIQLSYGRVAVFSHGTRRDTTLAGPSLNAAHSDAHKVSQPTYFAAVMQQSPQATIRAIRPRLA